VKQEQWFWPSSEDVNDFPDPIAFDAEWTSWRADLDSELSPTAEIFAREYIQNSWDTIQTEDTVSKRGDATSKGSITFSFVELSGARADKFAETFGLREFTDRYVAMSDKNRKDARLSESELITKSKRQTVRVLVCSESGGGGMWGHWFTGGRADMEASRLRFALLQTASEKKGEGSGGSWGHGKKAIANASKCRMIAVYTCHEGRSGSQDKEGVTRRFIGVTYWRRHQANNREHVGLGVLGRLTQSGNAAWKSLEPLENEEADSFVAALGIDAMAVRSAGVSSQRGTSYLIVEPSFEPEELRSAIERNWWPLVTQHKVPISVIGYDGNELLIEPHQRKELVPFIDAFNVATGVGGAMSSDTAVKVDNIEVGNLAVLADINENGFSYDSTIEGNTSLVALIRNDMVIAYQPFPKKQLGKQPFVRGAFNVDRLKHAEASDLLKMAEPHLHNVWRTRPDGATPKDAADLASAVITKIEKRVKDVRAENSKPQELKDLHFDVFADILSGKDSVTKRQPKPIVEKPPRDFSIQGVTRAVLDCDPNDITHIRIESSALIKLSDSALRRTLKVRARVRLAWKVLEDGEAGTYDPRLSDDTLTAWPRGFVVTDPGTAEGIIRSTSAEFRWTSQYFPDDWQVLPYPEVTLIEDLKDSDQ
jgi:hypothetical protein